VGSRWSQHPRWTCVCWALWWLCSSCFGPSWEIALLPRTSRDVSDLPWVMDDHRFFHIKSVSFWREFFPHFGETYLGYVNRRPSDCNGNLWTSVDGLIQPLLPRSINIILQWEWLQNSFKNEMHMLTICLSLQTGTI
jgi:hypothetical protein